MKFEPAKLTKVIEQNYSHLMPDFFEMQTEYLTSLNIIYHDLDASLVAMVLTSQLYKGMVKDKDTKEKIALKYFYHKENFKLPVTNLKIKEISSILNLPRETVRRKKEKLIKDNLIILDKKNKLYTLNTGMIQQSVIISQIANLSKFLSKFSFYFSKNKYFIKHVTTEEIKKDVEEKFLLYFIKFIDFQISYFANCKTYIDMESVFIVLLCSLNTTAQYRYKQGPTNLKETYRNTSNMNGAFGLNATSIAEITKVPRTTVLRKIANLEKIGLIKKDKFKRYSTNNFNELKNPKKMESIVNYNVKLLGLFFSDCLETYSIKH